MRGFGRRASNVCWVVEVQRFQSLGFRVLEFKGLEFRVSEFQFGFGFFVLRARSGCSGRLRVIWRENFLISLMSQCILDLVSASSSLNTKGCQRHHLFC